MTIEKKEDFQYNRGSESSMIRIAIVDDETEFAEKVEKQIKHFFREKREQVYTYRSDGKELLQEISKQRNFNIYLFDVEMPKMDGLELGKSVHELDPHGKIIFLTAYEKYAIQGIQLGIYYYILKNSWWTELSQILEKICREEEENSAEFITLSEEDGACRLLINDIMYMIKDQKNTMYYCTDRSGQEVSRIYQERISLDEAHARLPQDRFIRIIKGIIINMKYVVRTERLEVTMRDGKVFPISKIRKGQVHNKMAEYWGEK